MLFGLSTYDLLTFTAALVAVVLVSLAAASILEPRAASLGSMRVASGMRCFVNSRQVGQRPADDVTEPISTGSAQVSCFPIGR
jgi:hypothetical protein